MYDDADLQRSEYYFSLLQLLRIFGDWIRQSLHDLEGLEFGCKRLLEESVKDCKICVERGISSGRTQDKEQRLAARKIVMANWRTVRAYQRERAQPLLDNINLKTEEIRSLRDGVNKLTAIMGDVADISYSSLTRNPFAKPQKAVK